MKKTRYPEICSTKKIAEPTKRTALSLQNTETHNPIRKTKARNNFGMITVLFLLLISPAFAMDYADLNSVKAPAYRVGTSDETEQKSKIINPIDSGFVKESSSISDIEKLTYADLSLKKISAQITQDLALESEVMMGDLSMLWQGAATRSDIIKFALHKLSNPDAGKPDEKSIKKVLQTVASMSTLLGAGIGNPILSSGSFIGGNVLGIMSQDDKAINYKYTKVNDADMIILVRKVDELQQKVVDKYYDYMTSRQMYDITSKMVRQRYKNYQLSQNASKEVILTADAYYRDSLDIQMKARSEFYSKRASLEQLVGNEVFKKFEADVNSREKENK